ncbi:hypothetical protein A2U01_0061043, partial [Trifolium medium]|nr:hypothetical protein [Trifolium medium]
VWEEHEQDQRGLSFERDEEMRGMKAQNKLLVLLTVEEEEKG